MTPRFRVWDKVDGAMFIPHSLLWDKDDSMEAHGVSGLAPYVTRIPAEGVLMLSTGLHDATTWEDATPEQREGYTEETWRGVEIFEGDILEARYEKPQPTVHHWRVEWIEDDACFGIKPGTPYEYVSIHQRSVDDRYVIGHIWENPELLEPK